MVLGGDSILNVEENPYLTPTTETTESVVGVRLSSLFMRGARSGGGVGFAMGALIAFVLYIMHGSMITAGAVIILLGSVVMGAIVGMALAGLSLLEQRFRGSKKTRTSAVSVVGGDQEADVSLIE